MLGSLIASLVVLSPPAESTAPSESTAAEQYRAPNKTTSADPPGKRESIYALLSLRLGLSPVFHPKRTPARGLGIDVRFGTVFVIPPLLAIWPELGGSFEARAGFERAAGTVDLNIGLPAFLYYGVGFEGGVEGRARLLGLRHGLDLRFFQVFGVAVLHRFTHTPARGSAHEIQLMFSLDVLAVVPLAGKKVTMFELGERRVR